MYISMAESTGLESRILMTKNPADFKTRQVRVRRDADAVYVEPEGPEIDFKTMGSYRKPVPVEQVLEEIEGNGHLFANLGVSAYTVLVHKNEAYLVTVGQIRKSEGFSDKVAKLISGYVPSSFIEDPFDAISHEISEEFLPMTYGGKFLSGCFDGLRLPQPYKDVAEYESENPFSLSIGSENSRSTDYFRKVIVNGKRAFGMPRIYYHTNVNGAQLVFPFFAHVGLEDIEGLSQSETELKPAHLKHAEEKFEKGVLNSYMDPLPLYLLKLQSGKPNGEVFTFLDGKFQPVDASGLVLSEAFVPAVHDGIIGANNITLKDYLAQK
jgi:hypothetical protein